MPHDARNRTARAELTALQAAWPALRHVYPVPGAPGSLPEHARPALPHERRVQR